MRRIVDDDKVKAPYWVMDIEYEYKASAEALWPWLAQMGHGQAGWYSYDWIDNLGRQSYLHIDPKLQDIEIGQKRVIFDVQNFEENHFLTLSIGENCNMTWLIEKTEVGCRLVTRLRVKGPSALLSLTLGPAHRFMQNKQFRELEKRVSVRFH